jgi:hypothetical protein
MILSLVLWIDSAAQVVRQPLSIHYASLGAYSKNFSDVFSATSNQASLAGLNTGAFGVYGERRFMLDELKGYSAIVAVPTPSGTIGFQADYFGSSPFNETQLGIMYGRKITSQIDVGVKFNYHSVRMAGYGTASAVNVEGGAIFHLTDKLHSGIHFYNPGGSKLGKTGLEKLASIYLFGLGYEASERLFISTEIIKHEDQPIGVNAGLQYNLQTRVFIRTGISTTNNNSYASVGLNIGFGRIDINMAYHPQLGFTPGILLLINFKKPAEE